MFRSVHVDIEDLMLLKVSIANDQSFKEKTLNLISDKEWLLPMDKLWEVFLEPPVPKHLHIVVQAPPAGE